MIVFEVLGKYGFGPVEEGMEGKGRSWGEPWMFPVRVKDWKGSDSRREGGQDQGTLQGSESKTSKDSDSHHLSRAASASN